MESDIILEATTRANYTNFSIATAKFNENNAFIAYCDTKSLSYVSMYCMSQTIIPEIRRLAGFLKQIAGIAKTSGSGGKTVKVITPKYINESEEI